MRKQSADNTKLAWPPRRSLGRARNRWIEWAQSLNAGRMRAGLRPGGLPLDLAHPQTRFVARVEHGWQMILAPRLNIHLAIRQTLQQLAGQTIRRDSPTPDPARMRMALAPTVYNVESAGRAQGNAGDTADGGNIAPREALPASLRVPPAFPNADVRLAPLARVLARTAGNQTGEGSPLLGLRQEVWLTRRSLQFAEWVVEERKRIEEQRHRTVIIREERRPAEPQSTSIQAETTFQSPFVSRAAAAGMSPFQTPAPLDVERLTDQIVQNIDRRITAHRERMGKVF